MKEIKQKAESRKWKADRNLSLKVTILMQVARSKRPKSLTNSEVLCL